MDLILFLAVIFLLTFLLGKILEKIHIPWVFSSLLIGLCLAAYNPVKDITSSDSFHFLAELGMFFMLFIIGFELDIKNIIKQGRFIVKLTTIIILAESFFGSLLVHYLFGLSWTISILVAASFATVGEAVLLPILDEFKLTKTKLGQTILSVGVLDDIAEIIVIVLASVIIGRSSGHTHISIGINLLILAGLFGLVFILNKFHNKIQSFKYKDISSLFLFVIFFIFLFIGIGRYAESAALGAILSGIALKNIIPSNKLKFIDSEIRTMAYGFFAPIFFLWVGVDTDINYILKYPLMIILIMCMTNVTKIASSYFVGKKVLGPKKSVLLGISLSVKFSTSIVIIKLLFEKGLIQSNLYSVLVGTTIAFKFIVPFLLSYLIKKWKLNSSNINKII